MADTPIINLTPEIAKEIERLQQLGTKLPVGETWISFATKNLAGGGVLSRLGQLANRVTSLPTDLLRTAKTTAIILLLGVEGENLIQRAITEGRLDLNPIPPWAEGFVRGAVEQGAEAIGAPIFDLFVRTPLGLELSDLPNAEGGAAVRVLERLFGMSTAMDLGTGPLRDLMKGLMGDNAPISIPEALARLPMNVGLNWATGFIVAQLVMESYMPPLLEQANHQIRPTRLPVAQLLELRRRGLIDDGEFNRQAANLGLRDVDITRLTRLDESMLGVADLATAYAMGAVDEEYVRANLKKQGYPEQEIDTIVTIYLKRSETAGGDQLRAVAQRGFLDGHLTEEAYRGYLATAGVPQRSIDLEVEAALLVKSWSRQQLTVTDIKRLRQSGVIDDAQARQRLMTEGWSEDDADLLIREWNAEASRAPRTLTQTQILAYLRSGVLSATEAYDRLVALPMRAEDAAFLVAHPSAAGPTKSKALTPSAIIAAYKDDVLSLTEAHDKLIAAGETEEAASIALRTANVVKNRGAKPKQAIKTLTDAQILDAFKYGLAEDTWAVRELETNGHTHADAMLIVATEEAKLSNEVPPGWVTLR